MTTIHVTTDNKISIEIFDENIIYKYKNSIEVPVHYASPKINRRKGMICFCLTDDDENIINRLRKNEIEYYIFYSERDDHRDGYEGLETFVSEIIYKLLI